MPFEFDPAKSASNKSKHGIDFHEAQAIWTDESRLNIAAPYFTEPRYQILGLINGKLWSAIITLRGENTRIISVRAARRVERKRYHGTQKKADRRGIRCPARFRQGHHAVP
jgi:hypothetical protein